MRSFSFSVWLTWLYYLLKWGFTGLPPHRWLLHGFAVYSVVTLCQEMADLSSGSSLLTQVMSEEHGQCCLGCAVWTGPRFVSQSCLCGRSPGQEGTVPHRMPLSVLGATTHLPLLHKVPQISWAWPCVAWWELFNRMFCWSFFGSCRPLACFALCTLPLWGVAPTFPHTWLVEMLKGLFHYAWKQRFHISWTGHNGVHQEWKRGWPDASGCCSICQLTLSSHSFI